jgi:hypothetical protein
MKVALGFRLYMMRFGIARLAAGFANPSHPTTADRITAQVVKHLTSTTKLRADATESFGAYLAGKPGSPRYTPLRRALERGERPLVERQDLWLSESGMRSSVGALTKNYFEDSVGLAHLLGLVRSGNNLLLSRGRLCAFESTSVENNPFAYDKWQALFLGLWLLDVDGDWIWAVLREMDDKSVAQITVDNRVDVLRGTFDRLLTARHFVSGSSAYVSARTRLRELDAITRRNQKEGLNLGQPWSWFLIPRLELLVDALLFDKAQPEDLAGYRLSASGKALCRLAATGKRGTDLLSGFFAAHLGSTPEAMAPVEWSQLKIALQQVSPQLRTATGYCPLFESAAAVCVDRVRSGLQPWEVPQIDAAIREHGKGAGAAVLLSINTQGAIQSFKFKE